MSEYVGKVIRLETQKVIQIFEDEIGRKRKVRVYLDNCCYSRPYDVQSSRRIIKETEAKLKIQRLITDGRLELMSSL